MTPEDLSAVRSSWSILRQQRDRLVDALTRAFEMVAQSPPSSHDRAVWLVDAVAELVGLLSVPSRLADRARAVGETWPDSRSAPSYRIEGRAWMHAGRRCSAEWTETTETAWRQAWLLLSDVLAAETLSPFADCPETDASR